MAQGRRLLSNTGESKLCIKLNQVETSRRTRRQLGTHTRTQWPGPTPALVAVPAGMSALMPTLTRCAFPSCFAYKLRGISVPETQKQNSNTEPENSTVTPCRVCCILCPLLLGAFATSTEDTTEEENKEQKRRKTKQNIQKEKKTSQIT